MQYFSNTYEISGVNEFPVISHTTPVQKVFCKVFRVGGVYLLEIYFRHIENDHI